MRADEDVVLGRVRDALLFAGAVALAALSLLSVASRAQASTFPFPWWTTSNNLVYYGGPVAHSMNVVVVPWGGDVRSTYTSPTGGDPAFFSYLANQSGSTSDIGGVLAQYMDTSGSNSQNKFSYGGEVQISPSVGALPPATVHDSDIQSELAKDIGSGTLPAPAGNGLSTYYVVLFPPNDNVCDPTTCAYGANGFCAYHGSFPLNSSTHVLYGAMVDDGPGTPNYGYCGGSLSDLANHTALVSHEFAETVNDPLVAEATVNGPPLAWYNQTLGEIADICVSATDETSNGPWSVQKIWSNKDKSCVASESAYSAPTASFLANSSASAGQAVSFNAASSSDPSSDTASLSYSGTSYSVPSGIVSYQWNWGDGTTTAASSSASATHSFANAGNYQVSLTVTDHMGFKSTVTHAISIGGTSSGTAPVVSTSAATAVNDQGATLNGTINPEGQSVSYQFIYGKSASALDQSTPLTSGPTGTSASAVSATLSGLSPSTTYYYELQVVAGGQTYVGSPAQSFTTTATSPPPSQTPIVTTGSASAITASGAQLGGTINPGGSASVSYQFSYGTDATNLNLTTPQATLAGGTTAVPVSAAIGSLSAGTTYYFRLDVISGGQTYSGSVQSFTTLTPAPTVTTGIATGVTSTSANITGSVNPNGVPTTYEVQFGPTTLYGHSTVPVSAGSGTSAISVSVPLSGLMAHTTYHYRLVATSNGGTAVGADKTFTTATPLSSAPSFWLLAPKSGALGPTLTRGLTVSFRCSTACLAQFEAMVVPPGGGSQFRSVPVTVAHTSARTRSSARARVTIRFSPKARRRLARARSLTLLIAGQAASARSAPSPPVRATVKLR